MNPPLQIFCDLEGVLVPEMWPHVAVRLDIPALAATTREHPDYAALVAARVATLRAHGVTLATPCDAVADVAPDDGAVAFIAALRRHGPVTLMTDSFAPMNTAPIAAFEVDRVLSHRFVPDARGIIAHCAYWNGLAGKLIFPRLGGHAGLADHALLGLFGREIPDGRVHAVPVVVALDVSGKRLARFGLALPIAIDGRVRP